MRLGLQPRLSMLSVLAWCRSPNALSDTVPLGHTVQVRCGSVPHIPPACHFHSSVLISRDRLLPRVADDNLMTANSTGSLLWAKQIIERLDVFQSDTRPQSVLCAAPPLRPSSHG